MSSLAIFLAILSAIGLAGIFVTKHYKRKERCMKTKAFKKSILGKSDKPYFQKKVKRAKGLK